MTLSPPLRLGSKLSILIKHIVRAGSGDPESSLGYTVIGPGCWGASHDALSFFFTHLFFTHYTLKHLSGFNH